MATTPLPRPSTTLQALTNAYLAQDLEFKVGTGFSIECDDDEIGMTVRIQVVGNDALEYTVPGGVAINFVPDRGFNVLVNIKADSGTPNALINVDNAVSYYTKAGVATLTVLSAKAMGLADTALPTAVADGHNAQILTDVYGRLRDAVEDVAANANRGVEVDPLNQQYVSETLCELTAIASGVTGYLYVDMDGFRNLALQIEIAAASVDSVTVTAEISLESDATPATATYQDVTSDLFGVANTIVDDIWRVDTPLPCKYFRLVYVTAGGNGDGAITVFGKKLY